MRHALLMVVLSVALVLFPGCKPGPLPDGNTTAGGTTGNNRASDGDVEWRNRILVLLNNRESAAALSELSRYLTKYPTDATAIAYRGDGRMQLGDEEHAVLDYQQALGLDARCVDALAGLGRIYRIRSEYDKAKEMLLRARAIDPDGALVLSNLLIIALRELEDTRAVEYGRAACRANPEDAASASNLVVALHYAGLMAERARAMQAAKQLGYPMHKLESILDGDITLRDEQFYPEDGDAEWSVPVPKVRPAVLIDEFEPPPSHYDETSEAWQLLQRGDALKSAGRYDEADTAYREALAAQPVFPHAAHQVACNLEMSGHTEEAAKMFSRSVADGMSDYPFVWRDYELGFVRSTARFRRELKTVRDRYLKLGENLAGTPLVKPAERPEDATGQPPLMVILHGYGDRPHNWAGHADAWSAAGFTVLLLPGSIAQQTGGFIWCPETAAVTHQQVQDVLAQPLLKGRFDPARVFLMGFSQGAMHALCLLAEHPQNYAGAVPGSPGGRALFDGIDTLPTASHRVLMTHGAEEEWIADFADRNIPRCEKAGWTCTVKVHPGGHHLPNGWINSIPQVARFLLAEPDGD